ncbi:hypothetical protein GUJ93_ZPchr0015g6785 [Zizania palustris]|uniref:Uncharacterized protein n=1 Tax=Zizania palustris TaxID=103762 RepID=A0A8J5VVF3_ZIZPA|nr:hypothetical protein GUJ93_ZPchr0015g6785 [Zizania palustris]
MLRVTGAPPSTRRRRCPSTLARQRAAVAPAAPSAGGKAKVLAATAPWPAPSPPPLPPSSVVAVEIVIRGMYSSGGGDSDVDRRAAMYISRVQERLRRERAMGEWAMM